MRRTVARQPSERERGGKGRDEEGVAPSPPTFRCPTSNSSTPHSTIRCHVEQFDATSNSSTPRRKLQCTKSKGLTLYWNIPRHNVLIAASRPHAGFHRRGSKAASAAHGWTSNPTCARHLDDDPRHRPVTSSVGSHLDVESQTGFRCASFAVARGKRIPNIL